MISGEVLAAIPVEELSSVRELKRHLRQMHGLPPRFRQRLILKGSNLDDAEKLDSPMDLGLVPWGLHEPQKGLRFILPQ